MNFELFQKKLRELIVECGGLSESDFRVEFYARPQERSFHPRDPLKDIRSVTPIKIEFTVHTAQATGEKS